MPVRQKDRETSREIRRAEEESGMRNAVLSLNREIAFGAGDKQQFTKHLKNEEISMKGEPRVMVLRVQGRR